MLVVLLKTLIDILMIAKQKNGKIKKKQAFYNCELEIASIQSHLTKNNYKESFHVHQQLHRDANYDE